MTFLIKKAERKNSKLRAALVGVSGSGKTHQSLLLATGLGGRVCMIDTENGSGQLLANEFEYDVLTINPPFDPLIYVKAIEHIEKSGYDIIIIDSLSHAWSGEGGLLDINGRIAAATRSQNSFAAFRETTPMQNKLMNAIIGSSCDIIATMRCKTVYELQENEKGKKMPVKIGLAPIQRENTDYEFTVVFDLYRPSGSTGQYFCSASKDRTKLFDGAFSITEDTGKQIRSWLNEGVNEKEAIEEIFNRYIDIADTASSKEELREMLIKCKAELSMFSNTKKYLSEIVSRYTDFSKKFDNND